MQELLSDRTYRDGKANPSDWYLLVLPHNRGDDPYHRPLGIYDRPTTASHVDGCIGLDDLLLRFSSMRRDTTPVDTVADPDMLMG